MGFKRHTEDWGDSELAHQRRESILEVGGAYLFEAPQSGVRRMLRFLNPTNNDDVCCDSGAYCSNDAYRNPKNTDNTCYKPNESRQRRSHASSATKTQRHAKSIGPLRRQRNDWREIWDLSSALIFKALELVLILSLTIIRIGTAFAEGVSRWLDEGMLEVGIEDCNRKEEDSFKDSFQDSGDKERDIKDQKEDCASAEEDEDRRQEDNTKED